MKKILKKSLAIMVSAAICLTALIGCLSVSAANGEDPVYTVVNAKGKKGGTVGVNVTGADLTKICGQSVNIIFAAGLEIVKVYDNNEKRDLVLVNDETGGEYNILSNEDGTKTVRLVDIINFPAYGEGESYNPPLVTPSFNVTISVKIPDDAAADTEYPITFDESQFADYEEEWVYPKLNNGKITVVEDAPSCEHQWEFVSADPAKEKEDGSITFECLKCDKIKNETVKYYNLNTVANFVVSAESEIVMKYDVWTRTFKSNSDINSTLCVIEKENYVDNDKYTTPKTSVVLTTEDAEYFVNEDKPAYRWSFGIPSNSLCDTVNATIYCIADGIWYSGKVYSRSFVSVAEKTLGSSASDEDTKNNKKLLVDLLNYGSAAQIEFKYAPNNLANKNIDQYQYLGSGDYNPEAIDGYFLKQEVSANKVLINSIDLMLESKVEIRYTLLPYQYTGSADDVRIHFEYTDYKGVTHSFDFYNYDKLLADGNTEKIAAGEYFTIFSGKYYVDFSKLSAADMNAVVTATVYVNDVENASAKYGVSTFVARKRKTATGSTLELINAMFRYGYSAKNYVAK